MHATMSSVTTSYSSRSVSFPCSVTHEGTKKSRKSHRQRRFQHVQQRDNQRRGNARRVVTRAKNDENDDSERGENLFSKAEKMLEKAGVSMGPIAMSLQEDGKNIKEKSESFDSRKAIREAVEARKSIANLTTEEWKKKYVSKDGTVDLFMEDDFNIASRKAGAGDFDTLINVENVAWQNKGSSEVDAPIRNVKITDHETGEVLELDVPEGRYILFEAEQQGWELANACRMGCCTKCAVKVTKGSLEQIEALGVSKEMRDEGYALLCVAHATSDIECITQDEEEVYMKQFGEVFGRLATDKNAKSVVRDDFALEIADMDE